MLLAQNICRGVSRRLDTPASWSSGYYDSLWSSFPSYSPTSVTLGPALTCIPQRGIQKKEGETHTYTAAALSSTVYDGSSTWLTTIATLCHRPSFVHRVAIRVSFDLYSSPRVLPRTKLSTYATVDGLHMAMCEYCTIRPVVFPLIFRKSRTGTR
jgi:hypothetical protein